MDRLKVERLPATPTADESVEEEQVLPLEHAGEGEGEVHDDPVDDASADSFPASDPPSFTGAAVIKDPKDQAEG